MYNMAVTALVSEGDQVTTFTELNVASAGIPNDNGVIPDERWFTPDWRDDEVVVRPTFFLL
jgi:hypothetical protein